MNSKELKDIPLPYQIILTKLWCYSFNGEIGLPKLRKLLGSTCRIPKNFITPIINDMQSYGYVEILNCKNALVKTNPGLDILYRHNNQMGKISLN